MTTKEILKKAHDERMSFMNKISPYIRKKLDYDMINKIYKEQIALYLPTMTDAFCVTPPKYKKLKKTKTKNLRYIFVYFYNLFASVTTAYYSSLDQNVDIFFTGYDLYQETDDEKIKKSIDEFRNGIIFDDELLEFFYASNEEDAKLIADNEMIDIYFIQKLSNYKNYYELIILLNEVKLLERIKPDYIYSHIIKIAKLIK